MHFPSTPVDFDFNTSMEEFMVLDSAMYLGHDDESSYGFFDTLPNPNDMNGLNGLSDLNGLSMNMNNMNIHDLTMNNDGLYMSNNDLHVDMNMTDLNMNDMNPHDVSMNVLNTINMSMKARFKDERNAINMSMNAPIMTELHLQIMNDLNELAMKKQSVVNSLNAMPLDSMEDLGTMNPLLMLEGDGVFNPGDRYLEMIPKKPLNALAEIEPIQDTPQSSHAPTHAGTPGPYEFLQEILPRDVYGDLLLITNNLSYLISPGATDSMSILARALNLPVEIVRRLLPTLLEIKNLKSPALWNASLYFDEVPAEDTSQDGSLNGTQSQNGQSQVSQASLTPSSVTHESESAPLSQVQLRQLSRQFQHMLGARLPPPKSRGSQHGHTHGHAHGHAHNTSLTGSLGLQIQHSVQHGHAHGHAHSTSLTGPLGLQIQHSVQGNNPPQASPVAHKPLPEKTSMSPEDQATLYAKIGYIISVTAKRFLLQEARGGRFPEWAISETAVMWDYVKTSPISVSDYDLDTQRELIVQFRRVMEFRTDNSISTEMRTENILAVWGRLAQDLKDRQKDGKLFVPNTIIRQHLNDISLILYMLGVSEPAWVIFNDLSQWAQRSLIHRLENRFV